MVSACDNPWTTPFLVIVFPFIGTPPRLILSYTSLFLIVYAPHRRKQKYCQCSLVAHNSREHGPYGRACCSFRIYRYFKLIRHPGRTSIKWREQLKEQHAAGSISARCLHGWLCPSGTVCRFGLFNQPISRSQYCFDGLKIRTAHADSGLNEFPFRQNGVCFD